MSAELRKLREQIIVITGASSGIGLATARLAAGRGAKVVLAARSKQTLDGIVREIEQAGGKALAVECDVADRAQVERLAQHAVNHFGRIDTWVNNAGQGLWARLEEAPEGDSRKLFDVNFWGVVHGSQAALPHLKRFGGALINVGSEVSEAASPLLGIYVASKHAVKGYTDVLRVEVERLDQAPVAVTLIEPTAVNTPFAEHARNHTGKRAKLPPPMIEPGKVAAAILKAAEEPTRVKRVGAMSVMNTVVSKLTPSLADRRSAKKEKQLHTDEPPKDPAGTLERAGEAAGTSGRENGCAEKGQGP
jgi:short-subunit dehydrogenase